MLESILVLGVVAGLALLGLVAPALPVVSLIQSGWALTGVGLALGIPAGVGYHVRLRASLLRLGELPRGWWIRPAALHGRLTPELRPAVMPWFYLGGLGAGLAFLGCGLVGLGVGLALLRGAPA